MEALDDLTLKILIVAAIISIGKLSLYVVVETIEEKEHREIAWIDGFAILIAVFIASIITCVNNY